MCPNRSDAELTRALVWALASGREARDAVCLEVVPALLDPRIFAFWLAVLDDKLF
jgi:hypothetical protein